MPETDNVKMTVTPMPAKCLEKMTPEMKATHKKNMASMMGMGKMGQGSADMPKGKE